MIATTLIFDLDGTISDPSEGITKCVNHALEEYGYDLASPERVSTLIGPPLTEIFETLLGPLTEDRVIELVTAYRDRYSSVGYAENILYEGIAEVIAELSAAGFCLGVCTSKRADYAARILEMFGLSPCFDFVDGGDIHIRKVTQLEGIVANGVDAGTAVMIGDRAVDIDAGKRNAIATIAVSWGFAESGELADALPDYTVQTPRELAEMFR
jgi:phosphoglycolate phosphatase